MNDSLLSKYLPITPGKRRKGTLILTKYNVEETRFGLRPVYLSFTVFLFGARE